MLMNRIMSGQRMPQQPMQQPFDLSSQFGGQPDFQQRLQQMMSMQGPGAMFRPQQAQIQTPGFGEGLRGSMDPQQAIRSAMGRLF